MSCALARWFQKCIYVHSKYCSKWIEIVKRKGRRPLGRKCLFWPTCSNICYGHVYIFGISVPRRCWWANKKRKKFNFFSRPIRGEFKSKWALVEGKTTSRKKMPFVSSISISILHLFHLRASSKAKITSLVNRSIVHALQYQTPRMTDANH